MNDSVYYHQGCPVCGRILRIGIRLLGQRVYCQHCGGGFRATDVALEDVKATRVMQHLQEDRIETSLLNRSVIHSSVNSLLKKAQRTGLAKKYFLAWQCSV